MIKYRVRPERIEIITASRPRRKLVKLDYADRLEKMLAEEGFTGWLREYRFAAHAVGGPGKGLRARLAEAGLKDWRFDAANLELRVAIEIDGGNRMTTINPRTGQYVAIGRHTQAGDYRKRNAAAKLGWRILSYTPEMLARREFVNDIQSIMSGILRIDKSGTAWVLK